MTMTTITTTTITTWCDLQDSGLQYIRAVLECDSQFATGLDSAVQVEVATGIDGRWFIRVHLIELLIRFVVADEEGENGPPDLLHHSLIANLCRVQVCATALGCDMRQELTVVVGGHG